MTAMPCSIIAAIAGATASGSRSAIHTKRQPAAVGEDLCRRVVVRHGAADRRPRHPALAIVDVDDQLAHDHAVAERDHAGAVLEARVGDEARHQPGVQRADVAQRVPGGLGGRVDLDLSANRSHHRPPCADSVDGARRPYLEKIAPAAVPDQSSCATSRIGRVDWRIRDRISAPSIAATISWARARASRALHPALREHAADHVDPAVDRAPPGRRDRGRLRRRLEEGRRDRAARAKPRLLHPARHHPAVGAQERSRLAMARREPREHLVHQTAGEIDCRLAERLLAAREVVVERALRGAALGDDLLQPRRRVALPAEQAHRGAHQTLLVTGGVPHGCAPLA